MNRLFQYIPAESVIHRLDPRVKIVSVILLGLLIFNTNSFMLILIGLLVGSLARLSGLTGQTLWRTLRPLRYFFILLFLVHLLFTGGRPIEIFSFNLTVITYEGLYQALLTTSQFVLLIIAASIMTMTTAPSLMVSGLEKLLRPLAIFRLSSHDMALMISIALNFVPLVLAEIERVKEAQMARGAPFGSRSPLKRMRLFLNLFKPVFLNTFRKADDLVMAMEARGYSRGPRSSIRELKLTRWDYLALLGVFLLALAVGMSRLLT